MTHITIERAKLEQVLDAFNVIAVADNLDWIQHQAEQQATAMKQALASPVHPVAWTDLLKQAEEVVRSKPLWKKYIDGTPLANDIAVWMVNFAQEHTTPPAQPAPTVQKPVAYEYGDDVFWHDSPDINDYIRANGKALVYATPPASWMEMVTANLVREGVSKHKARELAEHFCGLAQRQWVGLTTEEMATCIDEPSWDLILRKAEQILKEKNA